MTLETLLKGLDGVAWGRVSPSLKVASVVCDSRLVQAGDVFVAIPGAQRDGRGFAQHALNRGAAVIVSQRPRPEVDGPVVLVANARAALAHLACRAYDHPSRRLAVVGVTGTNGKTTTGALIAETLRAAGERVGFISTVQVEIADRVIPAARTTPDAPTLQRMLADMLVHDCRCAVLEVSSHALEQRRIEGTRLAVGVFTNLTRDHLDYHGSMEAYFEAKQRLFDPSILAANGVAVVNADDPWGQKLIGLLRARGVETRGFGVKQGEARAASLRLGRDGTHFQLALCGGTIEIRSPLSGRYNVYNMLAAAVTAEARGVALETIRQSLNAFTPRWGRLERVDRGRPDQPAVFVDYAHTDDALTNVLQTVREITTGKIVVVFGCGGDRDPGKRPLMGQAAARWADQLVITSDNPRSEDPLTIMAQIVSGLPAACDYRVVPDRYEAISVVLRNAAPGDTVVVAGKGHETYQELAHTVTPFDDREVVRTLLGEPRG